VGVGPSLMGWDATSCGAGGVSDGETALVDPGNLIPGGLFTEGGRIEAG